MQTRPGEPKKLTQLLCSWNFPTGPPGQCLNKVITVSLSVLLPRAHSSCLSRSRLKSGVLCLWSWNVLWLAEWEKDCAFSKLIHYLDFRATKWMLPDENNQLWIRGEPKIWLHPQGSTCDGKWKLNHLKFPGKMIVTKRERYNFRVTVWGNNGKNISLFKFNTNQTVLSNSVCLLSGRMKVYWMAWKFFWA